MWESGIEIPVSIKKKIINFIPPKANVLGYMHKNEHDLVSKGLEGGGFLRNI
jgi:hypothetical protein